MVDALFQTKCFYASEAILSYIEGPSNGLPIILLHGIASRWQPFQPLFSQLTEKNHVFALDLRGHGQSSHTPGAYSLDDYTRDISEFVTSQIQMPVAIYGHSLGALTGINLAAKQPQWVRSLILGDPPLYHHDTLTQDTFWQSAFTDLLEFKNVHPDPIEMDAWLAQNHPGMSPERRAERVRSLETVDPGVIHAMISDTLMKDISLTTLVSHITCPVLLLQGNPKLGSALREQDVDFAIRHFSKVSVLKMDTIGHGILPLALLPQVIEFIDTLECR